MLLLLLGAGGVLGGCGGSDAADVVASTSHLAEIAGVIAGDRLSVVGLIPPGVDPHAYEPTPRTARLIDGSRVVVVDVVGLVPALDEMIDTAAAQTGQVVVEASKGLPTRLLGSHDDEHEGEVDPHFWLDPINVIGYVDNIKAAFIAVDPEGASIYEANAAAYSDRLRELDTWIRQQVEQIPQERRLLVTNHESFGYFADRYGFTLVGTVMGAGSAEGSPSAQELAALIDAVRASGAPAIFLETGSSPDLAEQVAGEAGLKVVSDLYTHAVGDEAPTYIDMMRHNVTRMVETLR